MRQVIKLTKNSEEYWFAEVDGEDGSYIGVSRRPQTDDEWSVVQSIAMGEGGRVQPMRVTKRFLLMTHPDTLEVAGDEEQTYRSPRLAPDES